MENNNIENITTDKIATFIKLNTKNYNDCKQLFYDIQHVAITEKSHFLGTIVYIPDRSTATCPIFIIIIYPFTPLYLYP